jgi:arylsulfatase A-like enzyme
MADYAGVEIPDNWQGNSFRNNLMEKTPKDWRNNMYYRYWLHRTERPGHFGIRDERYKLAFFYGQPLGMKGAMKESTIPTWEFFDLKTDPKEIRNAYNNPQYADIIQSMKNELINLRKELGDMDEQSPVMQDIFKKHWN